MLHKDTSQLNCLLHSKKWPRIITTNRNGYFLKQVKQKVSVGQAEFVWKQNRLLDLSEPGWSSRGKSGRGSPGWFTPGLFRLPDEPQAQSRRRDRTLLYFSRSTKGQGWCTGTKTTPPSLLHLGVPFTRLLLSCAAVIFPHLTSIPPVWGGCMALFELCPEFHWIPIALKQESTF